MNNNQQHKSTPDHWAEVEACAQQVSSTDDCLLELRSRVEALERGLKDESYRNNVCARNIADRFERLEGKYEAMRLAMLAWGKDVENLQLWSDQYLKWFEKLEGVKSKMVDLQPIPKQEEGTTALLRLNYLMKPDGSLVERVRNAIASEHDPKDYCWDEARAAIREVIAWLSQAGMANSANLLKREVEL